MRADNSAQLIPTIAQDLDKRVYEVYSKIKITLLKWKLDWLIKWNSFCERGAAKYRCQTRPLIFFAVFIMHLGKYYCSDIKFFPQPSISTTITKRLGNFINLSAIIVELRLAEHGTKFRRDLQIAITGSLRTSLKFRQKNNTENIAAKFCTACSNTLMHTFCENFIEIWDGQEGNLPKCFDFTWNNPFLWLHTKFTLWNQQRRNKR